MSNGQLVPTGGREVIPQSESLPMHIARRWEFPLEYHEVDGTVYYCIKDWLSGLTGAQGLKANHIWWNFKARQGGLSSRVLPYQGPQGQSYPMDFTDDEGLYKLAVALRITKGRTALRAIKDFLAKAGVFADEARRDPEMAAERLAFERRTGYLRAGKPEDWIITREQGVITRKQFVSSIYALVKNREAFRPIIAGLTNDVYKGLFASDVKGLRERLGISSKENPRDHFHRLALAYTTIAEESVRIHLKNYSEDDYIPVQVIGAVVQAISDAIGTQVETMAKALQIDIVSGRPMLAGPPSKQGQLGSLLQRAAPTRNTREHLSSEGK